MPSAVPSRSALAFRQWKKSKQSRYSSTGQEVKILQNDERIAAMLHGKRENGEAKDDSRKRSPEHAASNPSSHQSATLSHHAAQKPTRSRQPSNGPNKQVQFEKPVLASRKRKATTSLDQRAARRQRNNAPELKDEAYIRSTMSIPTPKEYPNAPNDVFKNPKGSILNVAHGHRLAECRSEFTTLSRNAYQCTAYYNSAVHREAAVGEGRTQASCLIS